MTKTAHKWSAMAETGDASSNRVSVLEASKERLSEGSNLAGAKFQRDV